MRPDRTVQADMSAACFPSLSPNPDKALKGNTEPKSAGWATASPEGKARSQTAGSLHSPAQGQQRKAQYAAALSPRDKQRPKHADVKQQDGMALSDSELAAVTQLLSLHDWAEPGLVRVRLLPYTA